MLHSDTPGSFASSSLATSVSRSGRPLYNSLTEGRSEEGGGRVRGEGGGMKGTGRREVSWGDHTSNLISPSLTLIQLLVHMWLHTESLLNGRLLEVNLQHMSHITSRPCAARVTHH